MKIRVLHLLGTAAPAGAATARLVRQLAAGLDPLRFETAAWFLGREGPLFAELQDAGVDCRVIPFESGRHLGRLLSLLWELRHTPADIIHLHLWSHGIRWAAALSGKYLLLHLHSRVAESAQAHLRGVPTGGADVVVAVSKAVAAAAKGVHPRVIYPGVPIPAVAAVPDSPAVIGTASRLEPVKNIPAVLEAYARVRSEFPGVKLEIAGEGSQRESLEAYACELGVSEGVRFLGWTANLIGIESRWSLFALASLDEGFPIAALEAMAVGVPVVAPAAGGIPELIEDDVTGRLSPTNTPDAIAERVAGLLRSPERCRAMGNAARLRVTERFSTQNMVAAFADVYENLLRRHHAA